MIASVRPNALRLATPQASHPQGTPHHGPHHGRPQLGRGPFARLPARVPGGPRVLVGGADPLARAGVRAALQASGLSPTDDALAESGRAFAPGDVIVWDLGGAARDPGVSAVLAAGAKVVVLLDPVSASAAEHLAAGVQGILQRDAGGQLAATVAAVRAGVTVIDPRLVAGLTARDVPAAEPAIDELTPREGEVLQHLAGGLANKEIAVKLGISDHTVKFHVNAILGKLSASTRTEAVVRGVRRGLVVL